MSSTLKRAMRIVAPVKDRHGRWSTAAIDREGRVWNRRENVTLQHAFVEARRSLAPGEDLVVSFRPFVDVLVNPDAGPSDSTGAYNIRCKVGLSWSGQMWCRVVYEPGSDEIMSYIKIGNEPFADMANRSDDEIIRDPSFSIGELEVRHDITAAEFVPQVMELHANPPRAPGAEPSPERQAFRQKLGWLRQQEALKVKRREQRAQQEPSL